MISANFRLTGMPVYNSEIHFSNRCYGVATGLLCRIIRTKPGSKIFRLGSLLRGTHRKRDQVLSRLGVIQNYNIYYFNNMEL
jgi:hypothetical protein